MTLTPILVIPVKRYVHGFYPRGNECVPMRPNASHLGWTLHGQRNSLQGQRNLTSGERYANIRSMFDNIIASLTTSPNQSTKSLAAALESSYRVIYYHVRKLEKEGRIIATHQRISTRGPLGKVWSVNNV